MPTHATMWVLVDTDSEKLASPSPSVCFCVSGSAENGTFRLEAFTWPPGRAHIVRVQSETADHTLCPYSSGNPTYSQLRERRLEAS